MVKARLLLGRQTSYLKPETINNIDWKYVADIFQKDIPQDAKEKLLIAHQCFAAASETHTLDNTVSAKDLTSALNSYLNASQRLLRLMKKIPTSVHDNSESAALAFYVEDDALAKLRKMLPLQRLDAALSLASATAVSAKTYVENDQSKRLVTDLWFVWIALVTIYLKRGGLNVAVGKDPLAGSPFVRAVEYFQTQLPQSCGTHRGYESIAVGIHSARRSLGSLSEQQLMLILAGWGLGLLKAYPGLPKSTDASEMDPPTQQIADALERLRSIVANGSTD